MSRGHSNKTVGQAGEFLVCAELGRRGIIASPFAGNVPEYDVIATDENLNTVPLQVKTSFGHHNIRSGMATYWFDVEFDPETKKQSVGEFTTISNPNLIMVYVLLSKESNALDRFFILTKQDVQKLIREAYIRWLSERNFIRPRKPESLMTAVGTEQLELFENNWSLIENNLTAPSDD